MRNRLLFSLSALLFASVPATAQTISGNEFFYGAATIRFTSRGNVGTGSGEFLQGFHSAHWRDIAGYDATAKTSLVKGFIIRNLQDQNRSTQESYTFVVRSGTDAAGPTLGTAGVIGTAGPFKTPPSSFTTPGSYAITTTLATPMKVPGDKYIAVGIQVGTAPKWTSDGISVWINGNFGTIDDNGLSPTALDTAWQIINTTTGATKSHPSGKRVWRLGFLVGNDVLQPGNVFSSRQNFSSGGIFPNVGATPAQGLAFVVRAKGKSGQIALVFGGVKRLPVGAPAFPGPRLWVIPSFFLAAPHTITATGSVAWTEVAAIPASLKGAGTIYWQAAVIDVKALKLALTNSSATVF